VVDVIDAVLSTIDLPAVDGAIDDLMELCE